LHRVSRYRRLFDRVPMALYLTAPDGTILDANPAMLQLLGYPDKKTLLRLNAFDLFADRDVRRSQMAQIEQDNVVRDYEMQLRRCDGTLIWALDHARAVRDASGRVLFYEGSLQDITERKRAQKQLQQINEQLQALIEASPLAIVALDRAARAESSAGTPPPNGCSGTARPKSWVAHFPSCPKRSGRGLTRCANG
jgi:PAS domain S-box-containing protein